ncbi:solute carrier family 25 member 51-like isoform X3 [Varroa jacobsoni]|uniref:Mitochondrial carrier protein n=1 Tax=Varroa destructor TaxID=109461 RepID=A0A7M7M7N9_VARDE|nr:solute carrier family 25 member 51-like isoform X2 [Varroa destructor]XP_022694259.1 solute carrier family 25 member 51-like isoform X3 [Varroa jacobsoni]
MKTTLKLFWVKAQHSTECRLLPDDEGGEFLAGAMAALVNISVTFPINKIMFRQMVHGVRTPAALSQLKNEGLVTLYKGCLPPVIQKTISTSIMFGTYAAYQRYLSTHLPQLETRRQKILAAFLAGTTEAVLCPLERAQCLLQDVEYAQRFKNTAHVFSAMSAYGVREYYRGLSAVLLRNGPSTMVFFGLRDVVRETLPVEPPSRKGLKGLQPEQMLADFVSGALVGAFVSTLFYPINVVKIRMQVEYGTPHLSMLSALKSAFESRDRRIHKLFYGVHLNYSRALLSWGITNAAYEFFKNQYELYYRSCSECQNER